MDLIQSPPAIAEESPPPEERRNHRYLDDWPTVFEIKLNRDLPGEAFAITVGRETAYRVQVADSPLRQVDVVNESEMTTAFSLSRGFVGRYQTFEVATGNGQKVGAVRMPLDQSTADSPWEILDANQSVTGRLFDQGQARTLLGTTAGSYQQYVAVTNLQAPVCLYSEQSVDGIHYRVIVDFSEDRSGIFNRYLGLSVGIILAARHLRTV